MIPKTCSAGIGILLTCLACLAQSPTETNLQPDRFLFVVDISSPMRARAEAVRETITNLIASSVQGQMHEGDELGLWTFNDQLQTGEFPLIRWQENSSAKILQSVNDFLQSRKYSGETRFNRTLPELLKLVAESRRITILLFSDGDEAFQGTPFDVAINRYFLNNAEAMKRDRVPFVTVLRGWHGKLIGHSITFPPWPVELPQFPPEPEPEPIPPPATNAPIGERKPARRPVIIGEPLIVSGRKVPPPEPEPVKQPSTPVATSAPPAIQVQSAVSSKPSAATLQPEVRELKEPAVQAEPQSNLVAGRAPSSGVTEEEPTESQGFWTPGKLAAAGGGVVILVAAGLWWSRRPSSSSHVSLITRSMDSSEDKRE